MQVKTTRVRRNGQIYQYAQLVESFRRDDGMPSQRVIASLGAQTDLEISNLRRALDASRVGRTVVLGAAAGLQPACEVLCNLTYLDVAVVLSLLRQLGVADILTAVLPRTEADVPDGDVVMALVAQRCVAPDSKLAATEWFARTAIPELLGLRPERFNNTRIHRVLEGLEACESSLQTQLASALSAEKGAFSTLFLDLTDTWFVGDGPSLATFGKTKEGLLRRKVGVVLLCDQDGFPLRWSVVEGRRHDSGPMTEMAQALQSVDWARGVPLVLDRAMGATAHIEELLATSQPFLTALTRNEFDAYTDRVPSAAMEGVSWSTVDAVAQVREAAVKAGMTRIRDNLCVLDLGVVTRDEEEKRAGSPPVEGCDKARVSLLVARDIQSALDSGKAKTLKSASQPHHLSVPRASTILRLLRLAPDLQESILAGNASGLSLKTLNEITHLDDFDAQRRTYDDALTPAQLHPSGRRTRGLGRKFAAPPSPVVPPEKVRLRAIIAFNPEHWVQQKETSDHRMAAIRAWTRGVNHRLLGPDNHTKPGDLTDMARERLQRDHLINAFQVQVMTTPQANGRMVHQLSVEPDPKEWALRQRFHGFQILVARPEETRAAADLVGIYRAKDAVEKDFQTIKSVLSMRPVRHRTDAKVRAHVTLCMLALLVERKLEHLLKGQLSAPAALELLADIHLNRLRTATESLPVYALTRSGPQHRELLEALHLKALCDEREVMATIHPR